MGVGVIIGWGVDSGVGSEAEISYGIKFGIDDEYNMGSYDDLLDGLNNGKPVG